MDLFVGVLVTVLSFLPVLIIALFLNRKDPKPPRGDYNDPLNTEDHRFDRMNKQGLGWGTEDNNRGGL